jgi:catechol 2,3-dioxygenase-like lactoylglutathione lyase family enzyme
MLKSIDHVGTRCSDPRKVVEFYTEVLNAKFHRAVTGTRISSGDDTPHLNVFLQLEDGSMLDFMDAPLFKPAIPDPNTPPWVRHIAMRVGSEADMHEIKRRVEARGLKVDGPIDRKRNIGVYFYDPFGNRLEITYEREPLPACESQQAWSILETWEARKAAGEFKAG